MLQPIITLFFTRQGVVCAGLQLDYRPLSSARFGRAVSLVNYSGQCPCHRGLSVRDSRAKYHADEK